MPTETLQPAEASRFLDNPAQAAFLADRSRFRAAVAGIGGGKSEVAGYEIVRHMLRYPSIEALVAAPSYPMIYRSGGPEDVIKRVARWWGTGRDGEPTLITAQNRTADSTHYVVFIAALNLNRTRINNGTVSHVLNLFRFRSAINVARK